MTDHAVGDAYTGSGGRFVSLPFYDTRVGRPVEGEPTHVWVNPAMIRGVRAIDRDRDQTPLTIVMFAGATARVYCPLAVEEVLRHLSGAPTAPPEPAASHATRVTMGFDWPHNVFDAWCITCGWLGPRQFGQDGADAIADHHAAAYGAGRQR